VAVLFDSTVSAHDQETVMTTKPDTTVTALPAAPEVQQPWMISKEAAKVSGYSEMQLFRLEKLGILRPVKLAGTRGGRVRYWLHEFHAALHGRR
jgi:hypothetical protein